MNALSILVAEGGPSGHRGQFCRRSHARIPLKWEMALCLLAYAAGGSMVTTKGHEGLETPGWGTRLTGQEQSHEFDTHYASL